MSAMNVPARLLRDESGFIVSTELVLISTVVVLGMVAGLTCVRNAVVGELTDVGDSIGALNQSYCYSGFSARKSFDCGNKSTSAGSTFVDLDDLSDAERAALEAADLEGANTGQGANATAAAAASTASGTAPAPTPASTPDPAAAVAPATPVPATAPSSAPAIPEGVPCPPDSIPGSIGPSGDSFGSGATVPCTQGSMRAPGIDPIPEGFVPAPGVGTMAYPVPPGMSQGAFSSNGAARSMTDSGAYSAGATFSAPGTGNGNLLAPPTGAVIYRGMAPPPGAYGSGFSGYRYGSGRGFGGYSGGFNGTYGNGAPFNCLDCGY